MNAWSRFTHAVGGGRRLRSRGAAELSVVIMGASLVGGLVFGSGLTRTAVDVFDGSTWFSDSPRGEVLQVNAATGQPEVRLAIGKPGDPLDVAQQQGRLVVTNRGTGQITSIDLATLLASGRRGTANGASTRVILHQGAAFVVDTKAGTIANVDPVTLATIGRIWKAPHGISDVAVDGSGTVWALGGAGELTGMTWSPESEVFAPKADQVVAGVNGGGQLVAHDEGVTIFAPSTGAVVQVGTGHDLVTAAPGMTGAVTAAADSPSDFVPASATDAGTVIIVGPSEVRQVDVRSLGCVKPGRPAVFGASVYVPCEGTNKVIRLDRQGQRQGEDIVTGKGTGDPQIVIDNGRLYVNVPGSDTGVQVLPDGSTQSFVRYDPAVPTQPVRASEPPKPPKTADVGKPTEADKRADTDRRQAQQQQSKQQNTPRWTPPNPTVSFGPGTATGGASTSTLVVPPRLTSTSRATPSTPSWTTRPTTTRTTTTAPATTASTTQPPATQPPATQPPATQPPAAPPVVEPPPSAPAPPPPPPAVPKEAPSGVSAAPAGTGAVTVSWQHGGPAASGFTVVRAGQTTPLVSVGGDARSATIGGLAPGESIQLVIIAGFAGESLPSGASNAVSAPTGLPADGAGVISAATSNGNDLGPRGQERPTQTGTVTFAPPAEWATFAGTCTLRGDISGSAVPIACNATSAGITLIRPADGTYESTVNLWVEATAGGPAAQSATFTLSVSWNPADPVNPCQGNPAAPQRAGVNQEVWMTPNICQIP